MGVENLLVSCCASCGIAEIDDVKLVPCDDCDLVGYCGDECQKNHKSYHKEECKKRAAELRDELLFKQPESNHRGDCPICMIPLSLDQSKSILTVCCSKIVCKGCCSANQMREAEMGLQRTCPFCREPIPKTEEECDKLLMKRVEMNDPVAMYQHGGERYEQGKYICAFEYLSKAAKLGDIDAHYKLAELYSEGTGVEKDFGKKMYHLEEAAIGGHSRARYNLGVYELNNYSNPERTVKHLIISATLGDDHAIKMLMGVFKTGLVSKEDLAAALRAHHAAVDATKSPQREAAEALYRLENNLC